MQSTKTKIFSFFLSLVMAVSLFPALGSNAATTVVDKGTCGSKLTWRLDSDGTLRIFGSGAMKNYNENSSKGEVAPWNGKKYQIKAVVIQNGVTSVGNYAFYNCYNLKKVVWPKNKSLKTLGKDSFAWCGFTNIVIGEGVETIGEEAFYECSDAYSITFPSTLKYIGKNSFKWCTKVNKGVVIPASVETIDEQAFHGLWDVPSFTGGAGLKTIGKRAFSYCFKLKTLKITSKVLSKISPEAFYACSKLKTVYFKNTTKLTKSGVKKSLSGSYIKTVKVKKSKVKKYKKIFKKKNSGRKVKVKK